MTTMTETTEFESTPEAQLQRTAALATQALDLPKLSLAEAIERVLGEGGIEVDAAPTPTAPQVPPITDEHKKALVKIGDVYGSVTPTTARKLNSVELRKLIDERETIDIVLGLLKKRKDESIREALANHMDKIIEESDGFDPEKSQRDGKGHWLVKHEDLVQETDKKIAAIVSDPKPTVDGKSIHEAHEAGELSREEYLAITSLPEVPRVFDEAKARKAIKKNPGLLFKLAKSTKKARPTLTIKVNKA